MESNELRSQLSPEMQKAFEANEPLTLRQYLDWALTVASDEVYRRLSTQKFPISDEEADLQAVEFLNHTRSVINAVSPTRYLRFLAETRFPGLDPADPD